MRVWLVILLVALVAVAMASARRNRGGGEEEETGMAGRRRGRPGRGRPGAGGRPGRGGEEEGDGEETTGRRRWRPRPGRGNKGKPGRQGPGQKKKKGLFMGSMAMKKCGMCVLKCKKLQRKTFEQCLSTNVSTPCYGMCVNATENMLDCLTCVGECRSTPLANGKTPNAWYCIKAGPCKDRCKARRENGNGGKKPTPAIPEEEGPEEGVAPSPPAPASWYSRFF